MSNIRHWFVGVASRRFYVATGARSGTYYRFTVTLPETPTGCAIAQPDRSTDCTECNGRNTLPLLPVPAGRYKVAQSCPPSIRCQNLTPDFHRFPAVEQSVHSAPTTTQIQSPKYWGLISHAETRHNAVAGRRPTTYPFCLAPCTSPPRIGTTGGSGKGRVSER